MPARTTPSRGVSRALLDAARTVPGPVGAQSMGWWTKGAMIMVTGRIRYSTWTGQNCTERYGCEVIAEQIDFLAKAKEATKAEPKKRRA